MALPNNVQQNILTGMQNISITLLEIRNQLALVTQMWVNEGMTSLTDADIQMLSEFAGVTQVEALACKTSFDALLTAIGDPGTAGTVAYKMLKLANRVP
jgi:hypothetical protein